MRTLLICIGLLAILTLASGTYAFHEDLRPCHDGETGYLATMIAEGGRIFTFLSSQDPPSSNTILCGIGSQVLIQIKQRSKEM